MAWVKERINDDGDKRFRMCDVASPVGLTDRAVRQIVRELVAVTQGPAENEKVGRSNCYRVVRSAHSHHELETDLSLGEFADLLLRRHPRAD
jgi:hypothetical protein